jgi:hypothetical protein
MSARKQILIGIGLGMAGVCAIAWTLLNMPLATGRILTGKVVYCGEQDPDHPSSWCMIRLDMDSRTVPVKMAREFPGQQISLIEMRKRLTGQIKYLVRDRGKP